MLRRQDNVVQMMQCIHDPPRNVPSKSLKKNSLQKMLIDYYTKYFNNTLVCINPDTTLSSTQCPINNTQSVSFLIRRYMYSLVCIAQIHLALCILKYVSCTQLTLELYTIYTRELILQSVSIQIHLALCILKCVSCTQLTLELYIIYTRELILQSVSIQIQHSLYS